MIIEIDISPKSLREALCVAQSLVGNSTETPGRKSGFLNVLQQLIDECDRLRPLGPNGKHGDLHTLYCGCQDNTPRVMRLKSGDWSFGHDGWHAGIGTEKCPRHQHHHHDEFCDQPTFWELQAAGIDPTQFKPRSRG